MSEEIQIAKLLILSAIFCAVTLYGFSIGRWIAWLLFIAGALLYLFGLFVDAAPDDSKDSQQSKDS